jgi:hypothetical protein
MQRMPVGFDLLSLTQMGMATWMTQVVVAQKFAEALRMQGTLVIETLRRRPALQPSSAYSARSRRALGDPWVGDLGAS